MIGFKTKGPWSDRPVFMAKAGSAAYGTMTPTSDIDYRGVFLAEPQHLIGLSNVETYTEEQPIDLQCFELRHYIRLCLKGSPLQLEMLYYPQDVVAASSVAWNKLVEIRQCFLGKHLKKTLGGFAQGDIKRIAADSTAKCGAKGKLLVEKYGYNTKHASNAYRLLQMAATLFTTGELVARPDLAAREEIIAIKNGKYKKEEFLKFIQEEDQRVFALAENCALPDGPDHHKAEEVAMSIYTSMLSDSGWREAQGIIPITHRTE